MALSDTWLKANNGKERASLEERSDREGMGVRITPKGKITFQLRYRYDGKPRRLDLGSYPLMSLKEARTEAQRLRARQEQGHDPQIVRVLEKQAIIKADSVESLFRQWYEAYCQKNKKGHHDILRSFELHVFPVIGKLPAEQVSLHEWLNLLEKHATQRPGIAERIADLVDDDAAKRDRVSVALKDPAEKNNRDHVDIIVALGMAKEGFDWIWCEHALTVGYRASLTEIVQIIGRATRDAPGKTRARFTNLIAEPDASEEAVTEAVNDTLKAIAASLLMEQVLAPRFEFRPKNPDNGPTPGFDYGDGGYDPSKSNVGVNRETGQVQIEIKGLAEPKSKEAARICQEDLNEVIASFIQDKTAIERGLFDEDLVPEELTQVRLGKIIKDRYPELDAEDQEAVRQHAIAALNLTQQAKQIMTGGDSDEPSANTALLDGVRKFAMDVRELDIDLIDRINPFGEAYAILAKTMSEESLKQVAAAISAKRTALTPEEAKELAVRAVQFKKERGRIPALDAQDAWERKMAEGASAFMRFKAGGRYE